MNYLILSPHFDDAVLSCGGLLSAWRRQEKRVTVWTLMGGFPPDDRLSPLAQRIHADWPRTTPREMVALRREEDRQALALLGAAGLHFDWADCIYRRHPTEGWLYDAIFTRPHASESALAGELAAALMALPADVQVIAPLAIGGHVDHRLVRWGAERSGRPLWYYPDLPYVMRVPSSAAALTSLSPLTFPLTSADVDAWVAAAACYQSQIPALFGPADALKNALKSFAGEPPQARLYFKKAI